MASWEIWFRTQNVDEVRKSLGLLETQIRNETSQIQKDIGNHYPEAITLADRLESLSLLGNSLESHISSFASSPSKNDVSCQAMETDSDSLVLQAYNRKVDRQLCSLVEVSLVQEKYALAARALYLRDVLKLPETSGSVSLKERLQSSLQKWIQTRNHVSQVVFHACIIHMRLTPRNFLNTVLRFRTSYIDSLLESSSSLLDVLKAVDSSIFIYNQVNSDWGNTRLSQRRILDEPEFANIRNLLSVANGMVDLSETRTYPEECYFPSELPALGEFTQLICRKLETALSGYMVNYTDVGSLVDLMRETLSQAEASLSSLEKGLTPMLDAVEPFFARRLLELITELQNVDSQNLEEWELRVSTTNAGLAQLAKLAKLSKQYAPEISEKIASLDKEANQKLKEHTQHTYKKQFEALGTHMESRPMGLETAARLLTKLVSLNSIFTRLGCEVEEIPDGVYEDIAEGLWLSREKRLREQRELAKEADNTEYMCWGDKKMMFAFEVQLLMDEFLGKITLSSHGLALLRQKLASHMSEGIASQAHSATQEPSQDFTETTSTSTATPDSDIKPEAPTQLGNENKIFEMDKTNRSSLLLRPLAMLEK